MTIFNFINISVGLSFLSVTMTIAQAGVIAALVGSTFVVLVNLFSMYLIVKSRNRFKRDSRIIDICDLGATIYGEESKWIFITILISCNSLFLMCYSVFYGTIADQLVC